MANVVSRYTAIKTFTTKAQKDQVLTATSLVSLTVYPNPAHDYLTIRSEAGINSVSIINLLGEIEEYFSMNGKKDAVLSLSSLAAGNYLLEVTTAEGRSVSKVVVE